MLSHASVERWFSSFITEVRKCLVSQNHIHHTAQFIGFVVRIHQKEKESPVSFDCSALELMAACTWDSELVVWLITAVKHFVGKCMVL